MDRRTSRRQGASSFSRRVGILAALLLAATAPTWPQSNVRHVPVNWERVDGAVRYELLVRPLGGDVVIDLSTTETSATVAIAPGTYQVRVISYNLFDKPASLSEWRYLDVVQVFKPVVTIVAPKLLYAGVASNRFALEGANFLTETEVSLVREGVAVARLAIDENGDKRLSGRLDLSTIAPGRYDLRVSNPENLVLELPGSLEVRERVQPHVRSIGLAAGYNDRMYRRERIEGDGFIEGTTFFLKHNALRVEIPNVAIESDAAAVVDLNLGGAQAGAYDLVAVNPGGLSDELSAAIDVVNIAAPEFVSLDPTSVTMGRSDGLFHLACRGLVSEAIVSLRSGGMLYPTRTVPDAAGAGVDVTKERVFSIDLDALSPGTYDLVIANSPLLTTTIEKLVTVAARPVPRLIGASTRSCLTSLAYRDIILRGENLEPAFRVVLSRGESQRFLSSRFISPTELAIDVDFRGMEPGRYDLMVQDSARIVATLPNGIELVNPPEPPPPPPPAPPRFLHPRAIRLTAGYPYSLLVSESFANAIQSAPAGASVVGAFPLGASLLPSLPGLRDMGIEADLSYSYYMNPTADTGAKLHQIAGGTNLYYRTPFNFPLNGIVRAGYGVVVSLFDLANSHQTSGGSSQDFYLKAGLSAELDFGALITIELGGGWSRVFYATAEFDAVNAFVRAGIRLGE